MYESAMYLLLGKPLETHSESIISVPLVTCLPRAVRQAGKERKIW